jgi:hypothetical protein
MSELKTLEAQLLETVERVVLKRVAEGNWLGIPHANDCNTSRASRIEVSREFLQALYNRVDMQRISGLVLARIEERIADKIFNALASEVGNDTKTIMCDKKSRELFRAAIAERIAAVSKEPSDATN